MAPAPQRGEAVRIGRLEIRLKWWPKPRPRNPNWRYHTDDKMPRCVGEPWWPADGALGCYFVHDREVIHVDGCPVLEPGWKSTESSWEFPRPHTKTAPQKIPARK